MANQEEMSRIGKSNSRRGKSQERRVARLFTEWTGHEFRRRRVEGRDSNVIERESTADIIPVTGKTILSIEVKNGAGFSIDAILANPHNTKFTKWWHQSSYDALLMTQLFETPIYPFLFFKPSPHLDWVAFSTKLIDNKLFVPCDDTNSDIIWFSALRFDVFDIIGPVSHNISQSKKNPIDMELQLDSCYICRWKDFVNNVKPDSLWIDLPKVCEE